MPPKLMNSDSNLWKRACQRVLISGAPLKGKTTSLMTFPGPRHILVAPGEQGFSTLRPNDQTFVHYWETDPNAPAMLWGVIWSELKTLTKEILAGKHGPCKTFAIDGLHCLYEAVMKANNFDPVRMANEENYSKIYAVFHAEFKNYVNYITNSPVDYVATTIWDGKEPVEGQKKVFDIFPSLPGAMAKDILGIFPMCVHADKDPTGKYIWELRTAHRMQAAGMHVPPDIGAKFPESCDPDWRVIQAILDEE